jgi:hypothetical protein
MQIKATEDQDQQALAELLDGLRLIWNHCPNGGSRNVIEAAKLKRMGVKAGYPDVTIYNPPPCDRNAKGAVIELKRKSGGRISPEQLNWIDCLSKLGWKTAICCGIDDAIKQLRSWGYM